ncbi:hypothetical protein [Amycolatopsis solani]|uniref:hypothetical protein n=1 Tax=Amycolatopsis solani TaxID=3028615 RepID=UPI0025B15EFA|nr:hypothetical protein [Amycolatopsis sp. MEP2-6]
MSGERTTVELIEDAFAEPGPGYGARLAAIRAEAADDGVALAVDLHGALVELRFERWALNRSPGELAGAIRRLAAEAGVEALRQGRELLGDLLPEEPAAGPVFGAPPVNEPVADRVAGWAGPTIGAPPVNEPVADRVAGLAGPTIGAPPVNEPVAAAGPAIRPRREPDDDSFAPVTWAT